MLVGSGRALARSATSVSPTSASMVGPGTCPLNPYPGTTCPGRDLPSSLSGLEFYVYRLAGAATFVLIDPSSFPLSAPSPARTAARGGSGLQVTVAGDV